MSEILQVERDGAIATLRLNRPDAANSIDIPMADALLEATKTLAADEAVKVVVLTGAGRFFCLGGDVKSFVDPSSDPSSVVTRITDSLHAAIETLATMEKPLLTAINGTAAGAGLGLAMLGDIAVATRSARFTPAYGAIGLSPDAATSWLLPRLVGLRRAQELVLFNRNIDADEAAALGIVTEAVDDEQFSARVREVAAALAAIPGHSAGRARRLIGESLTSGLHEHLKAEAAGIAHCASHPEARAALDAFLSR